MVFSDSLSSRFSGENVTPTEVVWSLVSESGPTWFSVGTSITPPRLPKPRGVLEMSNTLVRCEGGV